MELKRGGRVIVTGVNLDAQPGELIVLRLGGRTMPVLYTHLIPATFAGRARMNVANALAALETGAAA